MVTDKLVDEVREKIKAGLGEGVINSTLMMEGWPLADIESVLSTELKGEKKTVVEKKNNGGVFMTILGVVFMGAMLFGGMKLAMYLRDKTQGVDGVSEGSQLNTEISPTLTESQEVSPSPTIKGLFEAQKKQAIPLQTEDKLSEDVYRDLVEGYRIRPPKGWLVDTSGKLGAPVFFFGPDALVGEGEVYKANMNIMVGRANGHGLGNYVDFYIKSLEKNLTNLTVSDERKVVITGRDVYFGKIKFNQGRLILAGEVMVMVENDKAYIVTGLADSKAWDGVASVVETSMYTFNLL